MPISAASFLHEGNFDEERLVSLSKSLREQIGGTASCAFAFVTPHYMDRLADVSEIIRVHGHVAELVGATGVGLVGSGCEQESGPGVSVLALRFEKGSAKTVVLSRSEIDAGGCAVRYKKDPAFANSEAWIALASPFSFHLEDWLEEWNQAWPGIPIVGGLASGGNSENETAVFANERIVDGAVMLALQGDFRVVPIVSQGCRPIGDALPVTRVDSNVVYTLGSRPAYEVLEEAFRSLPEEQRVKAQGNIFAGLASNEYVEDFRMGDFLVRNILGADPNSGAVVISGFPRQGQTLQYQFRDSASAAEDFEKRLESALPQGAVPAASLLLSCIGRGSRMFGQPGHDAVNLARMCGPHPSAGFFSSGEIGPIAGKNAIHGYTASMALFLNKTI